MFEQLSVSELLKLGNLRFEKCDLLEASKVYQLALEKAKTSHDYRGTGEALSLLLRHSTEIGDDAAYVHWSNELETFMAKLDTQTVPYVWYCKGIIAFRQNQLRKAQVIFHRFLDEVRADQVADAATKRKWEGQALIALARVSLARGRVKRAEFLADVIYSAFKDSSPRGILGTLYFFRSFIAEKKGDYVGAKTWLQKAHVVALSEHNWLHYLYVVLGLAKISRLEQDFVQARFYLSMLDAAVVNGELKSLKLEVDDERSKLNVNQVDLELDLNRRVIRTKEAEIHLGRQHILLEIVRQLTMAKESQGLSKADIIQKVWQESYIPEVHDGKLYYNINRLRKLIEPDIRHPQYLLNARLGYKLAPELKIRVIDERGMN